MAGEWIKMGCGLRRHPKVVRIVSALKADRLRVVGALHAVWSVFDEHSIDGVLPGYSFEMMDEEIGWPGFSQAMHGVNWLDRDGDCGLIIPEFSKHNGESAKRRAEEALRKRLAREAEKESSEESPKAVRKKPDKKRTREEKRRSSSSSLRSEEQTLATPNRPEKKKATTIPDGFTISPAVREWARKKGFEPYLELHFEKLIEYTQTGTKEGKPVVALNWDAKLRTCISDDWGHVRENAKRAASRGNGHGGVTNWRPGNEPNDVLKGAAAKLQIDPWQAGETHGQFRRRIIAAPGGEELLSPKRALA